MNAKSLCRWFAVLAAVGITLVAVLPSFVVAAPLFPLPGVAPHGPGFVVHLPPIGPAALPPGGAVGPILYGDGMPNPGDPHHWEIELNNAGLAVLAYDVVITDPFGVAFAGNITLAAGASVYWDIHYADIPEVGGPWTFLAVNPPVGPFGVLIDSSVIEYNFPLVGAGPAGPVFLGGGFAGPLVGMPPIMIGITPPPIPEPATITLALCGGVALVGFARRRKQRATTIV